MFDFITYKLLNLIIMHNSKGIQRVEEHEYNHGMLTIGSNNDALLRVELILLFNIMNLSYSNYLWIRI